MNESKKIEVTVSNRTIVRVIGLLLFTVLGLMFIENVAYILQLILIAFFLSLALNPAVAFIRRNLKLKSRITATAIAYVTVLLVLGIFIANVVPPLVRQTATFINNAPRTISELKSGDSAVSKFVQDNNLEPHVEGLAESLRGYTGNVQRPVISTASRIGGTLISIITVLVLTFMMLIEGPSWFKRYWDLQKPTRRKHQKQLADGMYRMVTGYVNGQLLLAVIGASFAFVALMISSTLLGVSINALALAGILVFTGLIPMIGNTIGGVTVVLASLFVSVPLAIIMAIFFIIYQQIENITLQPYIQAKYNELTPLLVFVAALLGIGFAGFLGALIAIPVAGCIKILFQDYLERSGRA